MSCEQRKYKYKLFCEEEISVPIFSQPWWLDAVAEDGMWDVAVVEKGGKIWATMPYYIRKRYGFTFITMPKLTQTLGPYIKYPQGQKYYKKLSWEKELRDELIDQLPLFDYFYQQWNHSVNNWLPFYWRGFSQTTRYTYVIQESIKIEDFDDLIENDIRRRRRRKAEKTGIIIIESNDVDVLYQLICQTFGRQGIQVPFSLALINKLYKACKANAAAKILVAKDQSNNDIAANLLVADKSSVYYLLGGIRTDKKDLGGMDVVQHESIKYALSEGKNFDFEGSMLEGVEKYFRSFGAIQKPYFAISKTNSRALKAYQAAKDILKW